MQKNPDEARENVSGETSQKGLLLHRNHLGTYWQIHSQKLEIIDSWHRSSTVLSRAEFLDHHHLSCTMVCQIYILFFKKYGLVLLVFS